jgi:hypothetical protein
MKTFKSKIGLELIIPIGIIMFSMASFMIYKELWPGLLIVLLALLFISTIIFNTYYQIVGGNLIIKCSFFFKKVIEIKNIIRIKETNDPLSSPATSLDRLEIRYNNNHNILISPKKKQLFIDEILALNNNITIQLKK